MRQIRMQKTLRNAFNLPAKKQCEMRQTYMQKQCEMREINMQKTVRNAK